MNFVFWFFFSGYSLKCNYCVSFKSWDDCKNRTKQITCSNNQDRCFKANLKAVETGSGVTGESFGKGCDTSTACIGCRSICSSSSSVKISKCEIDCCKVSLLLYFWGDTWPADARAFSRPTHFLREKHWGRGWGITENFQNQDGNHFILRNSREV